MSKSPMGSQLMALEVYSLKNANCTHLLQSWYHSLKKTCFCKTFDPLYVIDLNSVSSIWSNLLNLFFYSWNILLRSLDFVTTLVNIVLTSVHKFLLEFNFSANFKNCPEIVLGLNFSAKFRFKAESAFVLWRRATKLVSPFIFLCHPDHFFSQWNLIFF